MNKLILETKAEMKEGPDSIIFILELYFILIDYNSEKDGVSFEIQKQLSRDVRGKRCYDNMQQIYRRTPMLNCNFNKVAKCDFKKVAKQRLLLVKGVEEFWR